MTPKVFTKVSSNDWVNIIGGAASTAGMTWQNVGSTELMIAFTSAKPTSSDPYFLLGSKDSVYDKNGSTACWVRSSSGSAETYISGVAD